MMVEIVPRSTHAPQPLPSARFTALYMFFGVSIQINIWRMSENAALIIPRISAVTAWNFTNPLLFSMKKNTRGTPHAIHFRYGIHDTTIIAAKMTSEAKLAFIPSEDLCGWISVFFIIIFIPFKFIFVIYNPEVLRRLSNTRHTQK